MSAQAIALLGQPNSGKSTLFNALTGLKQHVGNWPGKTVEKKEGTFFYNDIEYFVADLPGSYSLSANSDEEVITRDYIASGKADVVCILADSSQLQRSLYMTADYAGINVPCFLVLNLEDVAMQQNKKIDSKLIEERLGIPVILFSATETKNYNNFYSVLEKALRKKETINFDALEEKYKEINGYEEIKSLIPEGLIKGYSSAWVAVKAIEKDKVVTAKLESTLTRENYEKIQKLVAATSGAVDTGEKKFAWIDSILEGAVTSPESGVHMGKLDRIFTSKVWGKPAVILAVILAFMIAVIPALPFIAIGSSIALLKAPVAAGLSAISCPLLITQIICDIIIQSFSYVIMMLGFVIGVTFSFGLLEEVGVMARISYVFDDTMSRLGLQGKSVMPFLISFGCTMGGAAGTRVIDNWGQKVLTIALAWAVPCGAAWSIIPMLSTLFFGPIGAMGVIAAILVTMLLHMWLTAKIFGRNLVTEENKYGMIMELPPYHKPKWGALFRYVFGRAKDTFKRVFKVILIVCLIFWLLSYTGTGSVESSILYKVGVVIEPVTKFFGLKWQLFMAFIASSVGKEGAIGVIGALFTGGNVYAATAKGAVMPADINSILLSNITKPEALAFMFALTFNIPCIVALAATYQEIHSAKWTLRIAGYYTVVALVLSAIAYRVGLMIW
ncbi:MAG: ferrous iron transport protein B [Butyrivibrio sp.]|nr:ferrous iron transport protein B [Butyrivibrio sp.]